MPFFLCPEEQEHVGGLSTLVFLMKEVSDLYDQANFITVSVLPYDFLPFLKNLDRWGANGTSRVECTQRIFPSFPVPRTVKFLWIARLVRACSMGHF